MCGSFTQSNSPFKMRVCPVSDIAKKPKNDAEACIRKSSYHKTVIRTIPVRLAVLMLAITFHQYSRPVMATTVNGTINI